MRLSKVLAVAVFLGGASSATAADKEPTFAKEVKPFLTKYCVECHGGGKTKAGVDVSTYDDLMKGGKKKLVVPGKPEDSLFVKTLEGSAKRMPPKKYEKQPTAKEIDMVKAWIKAGAKEKPADAEGRLPFPLWPDGDRSVRVAWRRDTEGSPHD